MAKKKAQPQPKGEPNVRLRQIGIATVVVGMLIHGCQIGVMILGRERPIGWVPIAIGLVMYSWAWLEDRLTRSGSVIIAIGVIMLFWWPASGRRTSIVLLGRELSIGWVPIAVGAVITLWAMSGTPKESEQ